MFDFLQYHIFFENNPRNQNMFFQSISFDCLDVVRYISLNFSSLKFSSDVNKIFGTAPESFLHVDFQSDFRSVTPQNANFLSVFNLWLTNDTFRELSKDIRVGAPLRVPSVIDFEENEENDETVKEIVSDLYPSDSASVEGLRIGKTKRSIRSKAEQHFSSSGEEFQRKLNAIQEEAQNDRNYMREVVNNLTNQMSQANSKNNFLPSSGAPSWTGNTTDPDDEQDLTEAVSESGVFSRLGSVCVEPPPMIFSGSPLIPNSTVDKRLNFLMRIHTALFILIGYENYPGINFLRKLRDLHTEKVRIDHDSFDLLKIVLDSSINWNKSKVKLNLFALPSLEPGMRLTEDLIRNCLIDLYNQYRERWSNVFKDCFLPEMMIHQRNHREGSPLKKIESGRHREKK